MSRHPASECFHTILREMGELHDRKQADYGRGDDPFANVRASTEWGLPAWVGAMVRLTDKVRRLQAFVENGELANEGAIDSFNDIAVYAVIARVLYEQELDAEADRNAQAPDLSLPDSTCPGCYEPRCYCQCEDCPCGERHDPNFTCPNCDLLDTRSKAHRKWREERGYVDNAVAPDCHDCDCGCSMNGDTCGCGLAY